MGKKRERQRDVAKADDSPKKKHKKSKHRKHHKLRAGVGVVEGVESSPGSRLTLKIKLGNKVIGTSEAFTPDITDSPVESESLKLGSSLGEGDGDSIQAESSLGVGEREWAGSDISVGEEECPPEAVGGSDDDAEEEAWLDALEAGQVDDRGYLPQKRDPGNLTARQRAIMLGPCESQLVQLPLGKAEKEMTEEMVLKKTEKNRKRRLQAQKRKERRKAETVRKLLEKQSTKKKEDGKSRLPTKPVHPHIHYTSSSSGGVSLSFPQGVEYPLQAQRAHSPPLPDKCTIRGCENMRRYSDSRTKLPLCSLQCYKKLQDSPHTANPLIHHSPTLAT